jgi:glycosyltransferase involved in cell wall biosynthesis
MSPSGYEFTAFGADLLNPDYPYEMEQRLTMVPSTDYNEESIGVIYDISMLGVAHKHKKIFGLSRTSQMLLLHLLKRPGLSLYASCDLSFEIWSHCREWIENGPFANEDRLRWLAGDGINNLRYKGYRGTINCSQKLTAMGILKDQRSLQNKALHFFSKGFHGIAPSQVQAASVYHSPYHYIPEIIKKTNRIARILTIHDLIPLLHPTYCGITTESFYRFPKSFEFGLNTSLESVDPDTWVICPSQATRDDVTEYFGPQIDPEKVAVIPWAASDVFYQSRDPQVFQKLRQKYGLPDGRYILSLCALEPRKNVDHVIRCFKKLLRQEKVNDLYLVLAGAPGWENSLIYQEAHADPALSHRFIFTGYIDDDDLASLYSNALAFVYMSLYEGFGLPPLEAMQCGVPTITSNTSSLPEVVGDAGITLDPRDEDGLCQELLNLCNSPQLRLDLADRSRSRAKIFDWSESAEKTLRFYRRTLS